MKTVNRSKSDSPGRGKNILSESTGITTIWNSYFLPFPLVVWKEVIIHQRRARNSYMKMLWACPDIWLIDMKRCRNDFYFCFKENKQSETITTSQRLNVSPFIQRIKKTSKVQKQQITLQRINRAKRWEPYLSYWADIQTWLHIHSSICWESSFTHSFPEPLTFSSNHPLHPESISMALSSSLLTFCQVYLWLTSLSRHSEVSACCSLLLIQQRARPQEQKSFNSHGAAPYHVVSSSSLCLPHSTSLIPSPPCPLTLPLGITANPGLSLL